VNDLAGHWSPSEFWMDRISLFISGDRQDKTKRVDCTWAQMNLLCPHLYHTCVTISSHYIQYPLAKLVSYTVFTARCYASAVLAMGLCLSVCVCLLQVGVLYRNGWTNRAGFWHASFLPSVLHCVKRKFGYLQKRHFPLELCPKLRT